MGVSYWTLVEPVWLQLNATWDSYDPDEFFREFEAVPPGVGHLYAAHWCHCEVCNGGLRQFFRNSTGLMAPESRDGFRAVGVEELATVLDIALEQFGDPYPRDRGDREIILSPEEWRPSDILDVLARLDKRFFKAADRWEPAADSYADRVVRGDRGFGKTR